MRRSCWNLSCLDGGAPLGLVDRRRVVITPPAVAMFYAAGCGGESRRAALNYRPTTFGRERAEPLHRAAICARVSPYL